MRKNPIVLTGIVALFAGFGCGAELGQHTKKDIQTQITSRSSSYEQCYEQALAKDADTSGSVTLAFLVADGGKFRQMRVLKSSVNDEQLKRCVVKNSKGLRAKRAPDLPILVTYRLRFRPE